MKKTKEMNGYALQKYWYLGFLGIIGIYQWPEVLAFFQGEASFWVLSDLLWFLWFSYFIPQKKNKL